MHSSNIHGFIPSFIFSFIPSFCYLFPSSFFPSFDCACIPSMFIYTLLSLFCPLFDHSFHLSFIHSFLPSFLEVINSFLLTIIYSFLPLFLWLLLIHYSLPSHQLFFPSVHLSSVIYLVFPFFVSSFVPPVYSFFIIFFQHMSDDVCNLHFVLTFHRCRSLLRCF